MLRSVTNHLTVVRAASRKKPLSLNDMTPEQRQKKERFWKIRDKKAKGLHLDSKGRSRNVWTMNPDFKGWGQTHFDLYNKAVFNPCEIIGGEFAPFVFQAVISPPQYTRKQ